jgi:hypothetical protein
MNAEVLLISCRGALIQISGIKMWLLGQMKMLPGRQAKRNNQPDINAAFWGLRIKSGQTPGISSRCGNKQPAGYPHAALKEAMTAGNARAINQAAQAAVPLPEQAERSSARSEAESSFIK